LFVAAGLRPVDSLRSLRAGSGETAEAAVATLAFQETRLITGKTGHSMQYIGNFLLLDTPINLTPEVYSGEI
jgi:hypothetical protein